MNDHGGRAVLNIHDPAATAVQLSNDIAHVFLGADDLDIHDRFEHDRAGFAGRFLEGETPGHLEGNLRTVHFVVAAVHNLDQEIHHRVAAQHAGGRRFDDPVLHGPYI